MTDAGGARRRTAFVLTASDRSFEGTRPDASGDAIQARLEGLGYAVERRVVPDDRAAIGAALVEGAAAHSLVISTGGTGLTPRDVTPQATAAVLDYEVPGIAEAMRADGRRSTPFAALSEHMVGPLAYGIGSDPVAAAKVLYEFSKSNDKFVIKAGAMANLVMTNKEIASLAVLPGRDELLGRLLGTMQAPVANFVRTLNEVPARFVRGLAAVRDQKQAA